MSVELEEFSLRHFIPQFREFNSVTKENRTRLEPYFWWARATAITHIVFIMSGILAEKLSQIAHDLPYNKKFIIRQDGKFAGVVGLDDTTQNAPRTELWIFVTREKTGAHIASNAIKLIEEYASTKSVDEIYARVEYGNWPSRGMLQKNDYKIYKTRLNRWRGVVEQFWHKKLSDKNY